MRETLLVDLGGTLILPVPRLSDYMESRKITRDTPGLWIYLADAVANGDVKPQILDGVEEAVEKLSSKYALSCFADGYDDFTMACLDKLPVRKHFQDDLVIPYSVFKGSNGKKSPDSWKEAKLHLLKIGYNPVACIEDEIGAVVASQIADVNIASYLVRADRGEMMEHHIKGIKFWSSGSLYQVAGHLL